jgi:hypothetical protein
MELVPGGVSFVPRLANQLLRLCVFSATGVQVPLLAQQAGEEVGECELLHPFLRAPEPQLWLVLRR